MRRALLARPRPWREFQVGDQVAFWRKRKGRGVARVEEDRKVLEDPPTLVAAAER